MIEKNDLFLTFNNFKNKILKKVEQDKIKPVEDNPYLREMIDAVEENISGNIKMPHKNLNEDLKQTDTVDNLDKKKEVLEEQSLVNSQSTEVKRDLSLINRDNIKKLMPYLLSSVFGQDDVVHEVIDVLKVSALNIQINKEKPAGNYLFAGPSGVGKTELALSISKALDVPILVINMGEYGLEQDITKLIGSSPGYVGYNEGGILTNFIFDNPRAVILFDEIEKAHPSADKILLSIMDKGVATDNKGNNAFFKNTIIISTTNLGAEIEYEGDLTKEQKIEYRMDAIKDGLRPEILNRYDSIFQFEPLSNENYKKVVNKFLNKLTESMMAEHDIQLVFSDQLVEFIIKHSYDPALGGRPARRFIEKIVIKPLADYLLLETTEKIVDDNPKITMDIDKKGNICFKGKRNKILGSLQDTQILINRIDKSKLSK